MENRFELVMTEVFHDEKDIWHLQVSVLRDIGGLGLCILLDLTVPPEELRLFLMSMAFL